MFYLISLWDGELVRNVGLVSMYAIYKGIRLLYWNRDDYSMEPMLPKVHGKCDKCNGDLIMREDDQPEII